MDRKPTYNELLEIIRTLEENLADVGIQINGKGGIEDISGNLESRIQKDRWLSWIINNGDEVHFIHDTNHNLTFISQQCKAVFGYTVEEMHRDWRTLLSDHPINQQGREKTQKALDTGEKQQPYLLQVIRKDKTRIWIEIDENPIIEEGGQVIGIVGVIRDVSERIMVQEALKESEERYRSLVTNMTELITEIDGNGIYTYVNDRYIDILGYQPEELLGRNAMEFIHPDDLEPSIKKLEVLKKNPVDSVDIWRFRDKEGNYHTFECRYSFYTHHSGELRAVIIAVDITKRIREELENEKMRSRLNRAEEVAGLGHWELDLAQRAMIGSEGAIRIYGLKNGDFDLKKIQDIPLKEYRPLLDQALEDLVKNGKPYDIEFKIRRLSDGKIVDIHSIAEYDSERKIVFGVIQDITWIKDYEKQLLAKNQEIAAQNEEYAALNEELQSTLEELKKTNIYLEREKERAQESDRLKSAFLANMSHEIRTPMNSILGFSELLGQDDLETSKRQKYSNLISGSGEQLMRLINDIIDISKIESNQLRIEKEWCRINELLEEILMTHRQHPKFLEKKTLLLRFRPDSPGRELSLYTDCHRLKQIFDNLINNAVKFTDQGYIEVGYNLVGKNSRKWVEFYVKDTGMGIPGDSLDKIFIRFIQAENPSHSGGTGLGLSITKGLVELLGGSISVESDQGKGSIFHFKLPLDMD